ncbi:MAG: DUF4357 domain-containing protein [Victivallaceae bacterium]|nr:DUF4357 domain-containing protein [Victivallaceae bacterium]
MKPNLKPFFVLDADGSKVGVLLKIEDYELVMKELDALDSADGGYHRKVNAEVLEPEKNPAPEKNEKKSANPKFVFGKTEAELAFEESEGVELENLEADDELKLTPNNFFTRSIISKPVPFEMQDEFCSAKGVLLADGKCFKVLAGSKASEITDKSLPEDIVQLREELMMLQVLVHDTQDGDLIFTRDYEFENPNDAASIIAASLRDGGHCWVATENGKPMRQY